MYLQIKPIDIEAWMAPATAAAAASINQEIQQHNAAVQQRFGRYGSFDSLESFDRAYRRYSIDRAAAHAQLQASMPAESWKVACAALLDAAGRARAIGQDLDAFMAGPWKRDTAAERARIQKAYSDALAPMRERFAAVSIDMDALPLEVVHGSNPKLAAAAEAKAMALPRLDPTEHKPIAPAMQYQQARLQAQLK